ncbi:MAG: hypothetical protein JW744_01740 [Candidatus Diapherotrites archaeon]|uniref:Uncharacterized protein n=1 Tax=Candidatus Iainarchaeum sp. TaxID=3101447 RepID=A0A938YWL4_9ARCH|nr:hypothetical protein [Candidatus Diapherotrites archaeon]
MEISDDALKFGKMQMAAMAGTAISILVWAFFLNATGITINDLFTFQVHMLAEKVLTVSFALFLITLPLTTALTASFAKKTGKLNILLVSLIARVVGLVLAMLAFPRLQDFWIVGIFYLIALPLVVERTYVGYAEFKKWVTLRTMLASSGKAIAVLSIGLAVLSIAVILPQQEQYIGKFEDFVIDFAQGIVGGQARTSAVTNTADLLVQRDIETIESFTESPYFARLREKTDPDVIAFVAAVETVSQQVKSPEYRQQVEGQLQQAASETIREMDIMATIKKQVPFFEIMEQFLWAFHALFLAGAFSMLATFISKPMAVVYGAIAGKIISLAQWPK